MIWQIQLWIQEGTKSRPEIERRKWEVILIADKVRCHCEIPFSHNGVGVPIGGTWIHIFFLMNATSVVTVFVWKGLVQGLKTGKVKINLKLITGEKPNVPFSVTIICNFYNYHYLWFLANLQAYGDNEMWAMSIVCHFLQPG